MVFDLRPYGRPSSLSLVLASREHRVQVAELWIPAKFVERVRSVMLL